MLVYQRVIDIPRLAWIIELMVDMKIEHTISIDAEKKSTAPPYTYRLCYHFFPSNSKQTSSWNFAKNGRENSLLRKNHRFFFLQKSDSQMAMVNKALANVNGHGQQKHNFSTKVSQTLANGHAAKSARWAEFPTTLKKETDEARRAHRLEPYSCSVTRTENSVCVFVCTSSGFCWLVHPNEKQGFANGFNHETWMWYLEGRKKWTWNYPPQTKSHPLGGGRVVFGEAIPSVWANYVEPELDVCGHLSDD